MRISLVAIDTRGGVQPYVALGLGLQQAGHDTTLLTPSNFVPMASERGLPVVRLSGDVEQTVRGTPGIAELGPVARHRLMRDRAVHLTLTWAREVLDASGDADLLVAGIGGGGVARAVAERLGRPYAEAHLQPLGPPTSAFPGLLTPWAPRPLWRLSHRLTAATLNLSFGGAVRRARADVLGLPPAPVPASAPVGTVYGFSPHILPPPPEWGPDRAVTGYWTLDTPETWSPPTDLVDFLAAGPPPVCLGFGSMSSADPEGLTALVVTAVRRAGLRAVLLSGWGGLAATAGDDVLVAREIPHDWLFPRCAAVVHHGGAGTTGASVRAGVPTLVVPFAVDQPFWGGRVAALGVGPRPLPRRRLRVGRLAAALRTMITNPAFRRRAAGLGAAVRSEDGVGAAVRRLETYAGQIA